MQLKKIQAQIAHYKTWLSSKHATRLIYKWESLRIFQENWDIDASDFATMYEQSLQNSTSRRLWHRESYAPKQAMHRFAQMQPEFVRSMFKELFNEDKSIGARVDRFVFYCDELLREYKATHPTSIKNNHYHNNDYEIISLYLAFRYPQTYTLYQFELFQHSMEAIGSKDIPRTNDLERFFKVMRTLRQFLHKDEALLDLHNARLDNPHYQEDSLLLVDDFTRFMKQH